MNNYLSFKKNTESTKWNPTLASKKRLYINHKRFISYIEAKGKRDKKKKQKNRIEMRQVLFIVHYSLDMKISLFHR